MPDLPPTLPQQDLQRSNAVTAGRRRYSKVASSLDAALDACALTDGATVSFHHHLRNGDAVLNHVMSALAQRGLRDLHVAASSIFPIHAPLVDHMRSGVVSRISAGFISGPVGVAISRGDLTGRATLQTHGGRARALDLGGLKIDAAFVAAPASDDMGSLAGSVGPTAFGPMGYPVSDLANARHRIALTDGLVPCPTPNFDIPQDQVDHVVVMDRIGDRNGIVSGTTRPAQDKARLAIAQLAAQVIGASGLMRDGFSFQTGAGGISLAAAKSVGQQMAAKGVTGHFCSGGITGLHVEMLQAGLFRALLDVQSFDLTAVHSYRHDPRHHGISAAQYAGPHVAGAVVDRLDAVVLGATEVDLDFNVNVTTRADGVLMGGSGGHADTAAGARLAVVTTQLTAAGFAKIVPKVTTLTTPGQTIDVIVTEEGIAVNPARSDLADRLRQADLPLCSIQDLAAKAAMKSTRTATPVGNGPIVAVSEYRDGREIDVVRQSLSSI